MTTPNDIDYLVMIRAVADAKDDVLVTTQGASDRILQTIANYRVQVERETTARVVAELFAFLDAQDFDLIDVDAVRRFADRLRGQESGT